MKANQFQIYFRHLFAGLLVGLVAACSPMDNPSGLATSETPPLPAENTYTPTVVIPTVTPFVTSTPVFMPTVTKTPHPILTLTSSEKMEIMNYLEEKPGCSLPCWNGLTPGVSSSDEIQGFFARLGFDFGEWDPPDKAAQAGEWLIELHDFPKGTYSSTALVFLVKWSNGLVDFIGFDLWDHPEQFTIDKIEKSIGVPAEIKVAEQAGEFYYLLFLYPNKNLAILFHGKRTFPRPADQLPFDICIENRDHQSIESWFYSEDEYANAVTDRYSTSGGWLNWSKALGVSVEDLFQQLQQPGKCIPSP